MLREGCREPLNRQLPKGDGKQGQQIICHRLGCGVFVYSWKLPAYSGAFLLTIDNFSFFYLLLELGCLQV